MTEPGRIAAIAIALLLAACGSEGGDASSVGGRDAETSDVAADAGADAAADGSEAGTDAGSDAAVDVAEPESRDDGEPCERDIQCAGGTCLLPEDGFPDGFCTVADCESRRDCQGTDRACLRGEFNGNLCVALCDVDEDCRAGYECVPTTGGAYCYPAYAGDALNPVCASELVAVADVDNPFSRADGDLDRHVVTFDVSAEATAFMLVAWDRRQRLFPDVLIAPSGAELSIFDYASYYFSPLTFETVSPVLVPGGPQYVDSVESGTWRAEFGYEGSADDDICWVLLEETAGLEATDQALVVDVNFYFVGIDGLSAASAATDPDFTQMLQEFEAAYEQANLSIGDVGYIDVVGDVADRYSVIRLQDTVFELVQLSRQPGPTRAELLSVNVFFVRGFSGEMGGVLGVSAGIPGVAGIHGSPGTGLVFSANSLGSSRGNRLVGQTLAHELGHFLGLFHTTEQGFNGTDQLEDTPSCPDIGNGNPACPDVENLMFPVASWSGLAQITAGQTVIVRANPLTKLVSRAELR